MPLWHWLLLPVLAGATAAHAADDVPKHPLLGDTFRFSLGGFYAESTTQARLGTSTGGAGVDVNFEDLLGLEGRKWIGEAAMYWRFSERWRVDLDYFNLDRSASRVLATSISWGDQTFTPGTTVNSSVQISDLRAALGYSFFRRRDKELGAGIGVHTLKFKAAIDAAGIGGRTESATAPLPTFAIYGAFALTDTWALTVRTDWLSLDYDKYSGSIRSSAIDIVYQPFKNAAIGVGMHSLNLRLDVDNPNSKFAARVALQGPAVFLSVSF
jgi:hypothetical protein